MKTVIVVDYDSDWLRLFETLRSSIWNVVSDIAISIEHVGSTSVPGLAAKPIIDIDVVVRNSQMSTAIARLATLGYEHLGDLGVPQREAFRCLVNAPAHHLYLCPVDSPALANHIAVRDYLRKNPRAVQTYGDLKKRLALEFADDIDGYVEAKTGFLVDILRKMGFAENSLAQIEQINRKP